MLGLTRALSLSSSSPWCRLETAHLGPGELSQAPPGIPKGVSCVLTHLSRALSVSRFVRSWYISGEPEVLSGTSCTWVSKEKSESNLTLKSSHRKCFVLRRAIRNLPFISGVLLCQQRYLGVGLCPVTPGVNLNCVQSPLEWVWILMSWLAPPLTLLIHCIPGSAPVASDPSSPLIVLLLVSAANDAGLLC